MHLSKHSLLILPMVFLLMACAVQKKQPNNTYKTIAYQKFGADTVFKFNTDKTFVLCIKKNNANGLIPNTLTEFFVFKIQNNSIEYEQNISGASVKWYSNHEILIEQKTGIVSPNKVSYTYNLNTKSKTDLIKPTHDQ